MRLGLLGGNLHHHAAGTEVLTLDGYVDCGGGWLGFESGALVGWKVWFEVKAVSGCGRDCLMGKKRGDIDEVFIFGWETEKMRVGTWRLHGGEGGNECCVLMIVCVLLGYNMKESGGEREE